MTNEPTPDNYDIEDGSADNGIEICPHCETQLGGEGGIHGPVVDSNGREFEYLYDTDPGAGPFFCTDCWEELDANRRASENQSLAEFDT